MADFVPDWANTADTSKPDWATDDTGAPDWASPVSKPKAKQRTAGQRFTENFGDAVSRSGLGQLARKVDPGNDGLGWEDILGKIEILEGGLADKALSAIGLDVGVKPEMSPADKAERQRRADFQTRSNADKSYNVPGLLPKAGAVASTLAGQVAGAALSPENWVSPGRTMAGRALGNVGVGAGADALLQGGDIASGVQDNYDPLQTAAAGAIGGGLSVAGDLAAKGIRPIVENSPAPEFVKNLFRVGGDIEPQSKPFVSQVGQETKANNPELLARQKEVFSTGTGADINAFYDEIGGPRPSQDTIDKWLETREKIGAQVAPKPEVLARQVHKDTISQHIDNETKSWKNKPNINIIDSFDEITPEVAAGFERDGVTPDNTVGALASDGQVYIFANQVKTPEIANAVLFHESLGHYGLAQKFGAKLDSTLKTLAANNVSQFGKKVDEWMAKNPKAYGGSRVRAAEEVLAKMSEDGQMPKSISDAVEAAVRQFARNMGIKLKWNDNEVAHILSMAHDAVVNGKGRDVVANRFAGLYQPTDFGSEPDAGTRQMYAGVQARTGPEDLNDPRWFVGPDGSFRFEIADNNTQWDNTHSLNRAKGADLDEVLIHPKLFQAYPELRGVKIVRDLGDIGNLDGVQGYFDTITKTLHISPTAVDPKSTVLHEIQHWIQDKEGFAQGGNSEMFRLDNKDDINKLITYYKRTIEEANTTRVKNAVLDKLEKAEELLEAADSIKVLYDTVNTSGNKVRVEAADRGLEKIKNKYKDIAFDRYRLLMGEVEARDVQARRDMTPEERAEVEPFTMEGIEPKEMIPYWTDDRFESRQMTVDDLNERIESGDVDIQRLERAYENAWEGYVPVKRSDKEVERAAVDAGISPSRVKRLKGVGDLAERIYRSQKAADTLGERISDLLEKEGTPDWTVADADRLRQALIDHNYILAKLWDDTGEVGRALRVAKMGYTKSSMQAYKELLAEHGGTFSGLADDETLNRFARSLKALMANGNNPNGVNALVTGLTKPNWEEYLLSARVNMMLSGMSTHVTAVTDMIDGIGLDLMDNAAGLIPSLGREGLRALGIPVKEGIHPAEVAARMWGVVRAGMEASTYVDALKVLKEGSNRQTTGGRQYARIPIISKVGDLIAAEDQFFRAFATNMHLYGLGVRQAVEAARLQGKKPSFDDLMSAGISHARYPSNELLREAEKAAETNLLLADNILTNPIDSLRRSVQVGNLATHEHKAKAVAMRAASFAVNFLLPFVRTATNSLYQRVMRRSPLTFFDPATLRDLQSGGPKADVAMGRIMLALASTVIAWNAVDKLTGEGPENPYKKAIKMGTGWRPRSTYTEGKDGEPGFYNNSQNLGNRLGITDMNSQFATSIAAMREAYDRGANEGQVATGMKLAIYSMTKSLGQNFWLNDIADTWGAFTNPREAWKREETIGKELASFVIPNAVSQVARMQDPTNPMVRVKDDLSETVENVFKSRIPGLRETLPDQITPFGEPVQGGQALAGQTTILPQGNRITGGNYVEETTDPVIKEIARLDEFSKKAILTLPKRKIKVNGEEIELTNAELSEYQRMAGQESVQAVREMMDTEEWAEMSDEDKAAWISKEQNKVKKRVREELFGGGSDE